MKKRNKKEKDLTLFERMEKHELSLYILFNMLFITFLVLKLCSVIDWNWFIVISPFFGSATVLSVKNRQEQKRIERMVKEIQDNENKVSDSLEKELERILKQQDENEH